MDYDTLKSAICMALFYIGLPVISIYCTYRYIMWRDEKLNEIMFNKLKGQFEAELKETSEIGDKIEEGINGLRETKAEFSKTVESLKNNRSLLEEYLDFRMNLKL